MGINGLLPQLPGGHSTVNKITGFARLREFIGLQHLAGSDKLPKNNRPINVDIDTGTLLFNCAWRYRDAYADGDYKLAVAEFHRQLIVLRVVYNERCCTAECQVARIVIVLHQVDN